ncbi:hypothetical protein [Megavirus chiliensis]|uniref:Uncharacterized protein n=3 Tax=Megamimivirinae TaxID=3044648 RepID=A0A2L2DL35_MIMIV|nr:hypothetical protein MegaChil _gp0026 [Megavirus chiliensis]AEQ32398.1 hypothetical protein [Megavirus chiliensis]AGD93077.1 hypothetical protein LBA_01159 [Megavirus lba]AVG46871.1 hypothetical protein [Acanthamoeba polyphaga mimivirus]
MNDQPNDNKITNTTIQKKSDNDQLKITINYSKMNCPKTNDLKMNEKEICDENDSDEMILMKMILINFLLKINV